MHRLQKVGGVAALVAAATFVVGFALLATVLDDTVLGTGSVDPEGRFVAELADNEAIIHLWNTVIYVVFGVALVVLALALYERLKAGAPAVAQVATAFGLIWAGLVIAGGMVANNNVSTVIDLYEQDPAQAALAWAALDSVAGGLGGDVEIVGGLWVLLVNWAALRTGVLPRVLSYVGVASGVAGIVTVDPAFEVLGAVFGLGLIVWFAWLGIVLVRANPAAAMLTNPSATALRTSPARQ
jgi:hypothetical protein